MFVDGAWVDARSGRTFETRNPATGEVIGVVPRAEAEDVELAVQAARRAFEGPWSRFKPYERQVLLLRIAELFEKHWEEISLLGHHRHGHAHRANPRQQEPRYRHAALLRGHGDLAAWSHDRQFPGRRNFLLHAQRAGRRRRRDYSRGTRRRRRRFGRSAPRWPPAARLCSSRRRKRRSRRFCIADIDERGGRPARRGQCGAREPARKRERRSPTHLGVDKIVFTGSTATGQSIVRASAGNLKRVSLELGGKSPVIVCADADLEKAVPIAAMAVFANSGQICIAGSRLLVERSIHDAFVERLSVFGEGAAEWATAPILPPKSDL